jgi:hypothetical protein
MASGLLAPPFIDDPVRCAMSDPATMYDAWFVPAVFAPLAQVVVGRTAIPAHARVLDVARASNVMA